MGSDLTIKVNVFAICSCLEGMKYEILQSPESSDRDKSLLEKIDLMKKILQRAEIMISSTHTQEE